MNKEIYSIYNVNKLPGSKNDLSFYGKNVENGENSVKYPSLGLIESFSCVGGQYNYQERYVDI